MSRTYQKLIDEFDHNESKGVPMKLGTIIDLPDGRRGTIVYHSLIGYGIKWGEHEIDPADFEGTDGNTVTDGLGDKEDDWPWQPDALLREPSNVFKCYGFDFDECVGTEYEILME